MNGDSLDQIDREIEKTVDRAFSEKHVPDRLWPRIKDSVDAQHRAENSAIFQSPFFRLPIQLAAIVLLFSVTVVLISLTPKTADDLPMPEALVVEHRAFIDAGRSLDIRSSDIEYLSAWFHQQLEKSRLPAAPLAASLTLAGGRLCQVNGKRVASYAYQFGSKTISLYITESTDTFESGAPTLENSEALHITRLQNSTYASWKHSGWHYFLVADLPIDNFDMISASLSSNSP